MDRSELKELLAALCAADGVSGAEENIAELAAEYLRTFGKTETDSFNNVICEVGEQRADRKTLLLDAHIDEIGFIVSFITDDGFLKVSRCGGIDERVLPAAQVTVLGKERIKGVFTSVPPHLQSEESKAADLDELYIDIGMSGERARGLVSLGDRALIENKLEEIGELVTSKALDDRSCAAVILCALDMLKEKQTAYNIKAMFSGREEVGSQGAKTAAYRENADICIAVDVSFGRAHGESEEDTGEIGGGAMIGISPTLSRGLSDALIRTAEEENIPYQLEIMSGKTGTNADVFSVSRGGSAAATVSLPIRYMHTPVETASLEDMENTAKLIAAFCERGTF